MRQSVQDSFVVFSGSMLSQLIAVITIPIITRFFSPEAFGTFAIFLAITLIIYTVVCWQYQLAIVLSRSRDDAASVFWACIFIVSITTSIVVMGILFFGKEFTSLIKTPTLHPFLWLIPLVTFLDGVFLTLNLWTVRNKKFGIMAIAQVNFSLFSSAAKIGSGLLKNVSAGALILSTVFGKIISTFVMGLLVWRDDGSILATGLEKKRIKNAIIEFKRLPLMNGPAALLNMTSQKLAEFMLAAIFSSNIVGFYALNYKLLLFPSQLIGQAVRNVFFQRASQVNNEGKQIGDLVKNTIYSLTVISLAPFAAAAVLLPALFGVIFGEQWAEAGIYARWMILWVSVGFIAVPISTAITVLNREDINIKIQSFTFFARLISLIVGGFLLKDALLTILIFSIVGACQHSIYIIWIIRNSGVKNLIAKVSRPIIVTASYLIIILTKIQIIESIVFSQIIITLFFLGVYIITNYKGVMSFFEFKRKT